MASCSKNICGGQHNFFGGDPNLLVSSDNNKGISNKLMTKMTKTKMRWQELKDDDGDDKRGNKTLMRKQDNHHITYKEKTMVSRVGR